MMNEETVLCTICGFNNDEDYITCLLRLSVTSKCIRCDYVFNCEYDYDGY
jgi:hypothetical protein